MTLDGLSLMVKKRLEDLSKERQQKQIIEWKQRFFQEVDKIAFLSQHEARGLLKEISNPPDYFSVDDVNELESMKAALLTRIDGISLDRYQ
ncbi:MAG: hypothetical protein IPG70_16015 [Moraxellaceae bacterium]|nr:hypothetical protein [Moraxellaceae bacterium]